MASHVRLFMGHYHQRLASSRSNEPHAILTWVIRRCQVNRFNSGEASLLVASDAIGMGLNLNIKRIVFSSMHKFNGESIERIDPGHVLQIGAPRTPLNCQPALLSNALTGSKLAEQGGIIMATARVRSLRFTIATYQRSKKPSNSNS